MRVGVPRKIDDHEHRVANTPAGVTHDVTLPDVLETADRGLPAGALAEGPA